MGISLAAVRMITCAGCQYHSLWFISLVGWCSSWPMVLWWVRGADTKYDGHFKYYVPHKLLWIHTNLPHIKHRKWGTNKNLPFHFRVRMPALCIPTVWNHLFPCLIRQQVTWPVSFGQRSLLDVCCPFLSRTVSSLWDCSCSIWWGQYNI